MRIRRESNLKKLVEAKTTAEKLQAEKIQMLDEQSAIKGAVTKAEHRQKYAEKNKLFFKAIKEVSKRARLLGYSEKEVRAIRDEIYYPDGRPSRRLVEVK